MLGAPCGASALLVLGIACTEGTPSACPPWASSATRNTDTPCVSPSPTPVSAGRPQPTLARSAPAGRGLHSPLRPIHPSRARLCFLHALCHAKTVLHGDTLCGVPPASPGPARAGDSSECAKDQAAYLNH